MSSNFKKFTPAWWLQNAHLQTIFPIAYLTAKAFPQREEKGRFNEIRKTINSDSLWYAIYFPQFKNLSETQKKNYLIK